jgi:hypothetical protein
VRDLLADTSRPSTTFPPDERAFVFDNDATGQSVTRLLAERYMTVAEQLSAGAISHLPDLTGCDPALGEDTCARQFIERFGQRAFRRPLAPDEQQDLLDAFASGLDEGGFDTGVQAVIEVVLQSPEFLYRVEIGDAGSSAPSPRLSSWQLASRLSYLFWGTMPDELLFEAAGTGRLENDRGVASEAERMLADPRARVTLAHFHEEWLGLEKLDHLEKDPSVYPTFSAELGTLFRAETIGFVDSVMWGGDARVETLLAAPYTFMNAKLALFYGVPGLAGSTFRRVDLDPSQRAGLLTQGSLLSSLAKFDQSSPVHRGKFVRERLFCTTLQPPPPNIAVRPPPHHARTFPPTFERPVLLDLPRAHRSHRSRFRELRRGRALSLCRERQAGRRRRGAHRDRCGRGFTWRSRARRQIGLERRGHEMYGSAMVPLRLRPQRDRRGRVHRRTSGRCAP